MNNTQIIEQAAIASGFYTQEEVSRFSAEGKIIPFFTMTTWKKKGYVPKEGISGYEACLWKRRRNAEGEDLPGSFFKVKCHLFHPSQVEEIKDKNRIMEN